MTKKCFRCGEEKDMSEFYPHPKMKDGHLNKCIQCTKADALEYRKAHLEEVREYDRKRSANPLFRQRQNAYILKKKTEDPDGYRKMRAKINQRYRQKYRDKSRARWAVSDAIIAGKIKAPCQCTKCGTIAKLEAHHEDYSKPLAVVWLCDRCHKERHREINAERRKIKDVL